ncbi:MAG: hypothetical protein R3A79_27215 [Nannocystaceae bacterium]
MHVASAIAVALAWIAVGAAIHRRLRGAQPTVARLEQGVLAGAATLAIAGLVGVLLGVLGAFASPWLALVGAALTAAIWPRAPLPTDARAAPARRSWGPTIALLVALLGGLALRAPLHRASLAGRDQGTYVLRARHLLRSGRFDLRDRVLAFAGAQTDRASAFDLLGLYPTDGDPWRRGIYEGAYRPGLYLADRSAGRVVPQFLHMHPALLGLWGAIFGAENVAGILYLYAALSLLAVAAIARRLWPTRPWAGAIAAALLAAHPLVIWVQRTPLTETLALPLGLAALLAALGERRLLTAALLAALAWLRGNAWLAAPLLLAILWLRGPDAARRRAPLLYAGLLAASLVLHAQTVFPYLYDELNRQLGALLPVRPWTLSALALAGVVVWGLVDRGIFDRLRGRSALAAARRQLPRALVLAALAAIATWLFRQPEELRAPPYSRLDHALAGLTPALLIAALVGALRLLWRPPTADAWTLAIASVPLTTLALYAQRNLPHAGLFYFGRYLVPELAPLVIFLALSALFAGLDALAVLAARARRPRVHAGLEIAAPALLVGAVAWPLVTQPVVRVHEHAGTERLVEAIARDLPDGAVVVAGGEGWHSSHAFNQVGGALVLARGVEVIPYRSAEAAYATLHALLVDGFAGPHAPVYLLLGEASHAYTRADGALVAAIDDLLPAPLRARTIGLYELYSDRLTRDVMALPSRVTRSALRLGLFEVTVDPSLALAVRRWRFVDGEARGPGGLRLKGARWKGGRLCLSRKRDLVLTLPPSDAPLAVILVGGAGSRGGAGRWRLHVGDEAVDLRPPPRRREQSTLGPFPVAPAQARAGATIRLRGSGSTHGESPCRDGELAELRVIDDRAPPTASSGPEASARSFAPPRDLGHPPKQATWVRGRSLSRLRPGIRPDPAIEGQSIVVDAGAPLRFPATALPPGPGDWVAHLTHVRGAPLRLEVRVDGELAPPIELPADRDSSWQAPPIPWRAAATPTVVEVRLVGPEGSSVGLRDLAFFADAPLLSAQAPP